LRALRIITSSSTPSDQGLLLPNACSITIAVR
jgi:hypothetical protein